MIGRAVIYSASDHGLELVPHTAQEFGPTITENSFRNAIVGNQVAIQGFGHGGGDVASNWDENDIPRKHIYHRHHKPLPVAGLERAYDINTDSVPWPLGSEAPNGLLPWVIVGALLAASAGAGHFIGNVVALVVRVTLLELG